MINLLNCRCLLRTIRTTLFDSPVENRNCVMGDQKNCRGRFPPSLTTRRSQSFDYHRSRRYLNGVNSPTTSQSLRRSFSACNQGRYQDPKYQAALKRVEEEQVRKRMLQMRRFEYTALGKQLQSGTAAPPKNSIRFTVLSYNVLAQYLLEEHTYLYKNVDPDALNWKKRSERIIRDIHDTEADVLCFQEIQSDHFDSFYVPRLKRLGFAGIFKKRTGEKMDGCAIFYRMSVFDLRESISVEYCKPNVQLLDRDNIGLIALLTPRHHKPTSGPAPFLCVATTHLLYNPKRHDIKLAQLQLLFAELDHIAFKHADGETHAYHPVILTGDFNLTPDTSIYQFITGGSLQYKGLGRRDLVPQSSGVILDDELIPPCLLVTDQCQHLHATVKRSSTSEEKDSTSASVSFASGQLSHQLRLQSVYPHRLDRLNGAEEATTHQNKWVTVDYIFHNDTKLENSSLHLLCRLGLLSGSEIKSLGGLPSVATPSDHLPLAASFLWECGEKK